MATVWEKMLIKLAEDKNYAQPILAEMGIRTEPLYDHKGYTFYINGERLNHDCEFTIWEKLVNYLKNKK